MGIFNKLKKIFKQNNFISHYGLEEWWKNEFSEEEREYIVSKKSEVVNGKNNYTNKSPAQYLRELSLWFNTKEDSKIALKLLNKADKLVDSALNKHFIYNEMIKSNYKKRNENEKHYNQAIIACKKQIEISDKAIQEFKNQYEDNIRKTYILYEDEYTFEEYKKKELKENPFTLPSHRGFKQLAIIRHKQGEYEEVIELCKKAKKQGWYGDWDKRIKRAENQL